jgi:hypothetical protein
MFAIFSTKPNFGIRRYALYKYDTTNENLWSNIRNVPVVDTLYLEESTITPVAKQIKIKINGTTKVSTYYWHTDWELVYNGNIIPIYDFINKHIIFQDEVPLASCKMSTGEDDYTEWCNLRIVEQINQYHNMSDTIDLSQLYSITETVGNWVSGMTGNINLTGSFAGNISIGGGFAGLTLMNYNGISGPTGSSGPTGPSAPTGSSGPTGSSDLPRFVAEALVKTNRDANNECSISMIPFKDCFQVSVTNCYHCFDTDSLKEWMNNKKTCPLCKKYITSVTVLCQS